MPLRSEIDLDAPSEDLVAAVLGRHALIKDVGPILEGRSPSESSASLVVSRYKGATCPPWLAAQLLGCIGHSLAYDTALEILEEAPGALAECYAAGALVAMWPTRASNDLVRIVHNSERKASREAAAWALGLLPLTMELARGLVDLALLRKVSIAPVANALAQAGGVSQETQASVVALLTTPRDIDDDERRRLVTEVVWDLLSSSRRKDGELLLPRLLPAVSHALADPSFKMRPSKRKLLNEWVSSERAG